MALVASNLRYDNTGSLKLVRGTLAFDSSYPTGGEALSATTVGLSRFVRLKLNQEGGALFDVVYGSTEPTSVNIIVRSTSSHSASGSAFGGNSVRVTDDDSASSNGVAVYAHTLDGVHAYFEFVSPTNANGTGTTENGGETYFMRDSDAAATGGLAVYFDEDGATADSRLLVVSPTGQDLYVPLSSSNEFIKLTHDASAASNGVQVYFDEDAANSYSRLLFTSPTNTQGSMNTDDTYRPLNQAESVSATASAFAEYANGTNLSALTAVEFEAYGY